MLLARLGEPPRKQLSKQRVLGVLPIGLSGRLRLCCSMCLLLVQCLHTDSLILAVFRASFQSCAESSIAKWYRCRRPVGPPGSHLAHLDPTYWSSVQGAALVLHQSASDSEVLSLALRWVLQLLLLLLQKMALSLRLYSELLSLCVCLEKLLLLLVYLLTVHLLT